MKQKAIMIIALLALVSMMIIPASAETLTGTLGASGSSSSSFSLLNWTGSAGQWTHIDVRSIEYTRGALALVHFDVAGHLPTYTSATIAGNTTTVTLKIGGVVVGNGTLGFMRKWNNNWPTPTEIEGYQYLMFSDYNIGSRTGDYVIEIANVQPGFEVGSTFPYPAGSHTNDATPAGKMAFTSVGGYKPGGDYIFTQDVNFANGYTATKPQGLGISGTVNKTILGTNYPSRALIYDGTTNAVLTSQPGISTLDFSFNVPAQSIKIGSQNSLNVYYYSPILFAPTVTPTPTTTWTDTDPKPAGYTRTWFNAVDGTAGSVIYGAALKLKDVQNGSWKNNTAGYSYIDTLPNHTIDAYGSMTGYSSDTRLALPAADTVYELTLWSGLLAPGSGNVNLLVVVTDATTGYTLDRVSLTSTIPSGAQTGGMTGSAGTETFVVPNMSFITVSGSKAGYRSATGTITTTAFGPDTLRIPLSKLTVTPTITATPLPGEVTARPTIDARTGNQKDAAMMDIIRNNGESLITVAILVTFVSLIGLLRKGM